MRKSLLLFVAVFLVILGCKQKQNGVILPDIKSSFSHQLLRKDSSISVDSFYLIGIDTMTMKISLVHQRYPFYHILERLNTQIEIEKKLTDQIKGESLNDVLEQLKTLAEEKKYVSYEIDSLNSLLISADSITPIGYRAIYKVTVSKIDKFKVTDTIAYSLSLNMELSDWDRNIEKAIDSLAAGNHVLRGPFNLKNPLQQ